MKYIQWRRRSLLAATLSASIALAQEPQWGRDAGPAAAPVDVPAAAPVLEPVAVPVAAPVVEMVGAVDAGVVEVAAPTVPVAPPPVAEEPEQKAKGETVVTGSRIRRKELTGTAPVVVFTAEQIKASGRLNVGEFLQTMAQQGNGANRNANNGGDGAIRVNLRSLGSAATLVLLNGRRLTPGGTGADVSVDMSTIPTNVIERIEVLTDGASAVYGSDAIAGVVNIITLKKWKGAEINVVGGVSGRGDGQTLDVNGMIGTTSEKGSLLFSLGYYNTQPIFAGNRDYSTEQRNYNSEEMAETRVGSGTVPGGRIVLPASQAGVQNGNSAWNELVRNNPNSTNFTRDLTTGKWRPFLGPALAVDNGDGYNFQPFNYLVTPQERFNVFTTGEYQLAKFARLYVDGFYTKRTSTQELAPEPLVGDGEGLIVSANNIYNPFGRDFAAVRRRLAEFGGRITTQDIHSFHVSPGIEFTAPESFGPLKGWVLDLNMIASRTEATVVNVGNLRVPRLQNAVGPSFIGADGTPTCGTPDAPIDGCTPLNLFGGPGSITKDQLDYLRYTGISRGFNQQLGAQANISGGLFKLWAEAPVGLAVGYDFRALVGGDTPNPITASGETSGNKSEPTFGGYNVNELYAELSIPIVEKLPGVERLEITAAGRFSAYSNFGTALNYKLGARYSPFKDIALRGTISSAFRAPTIPELFAGQADNFAAVSDPCGEKVMAGSAKETNCGAAANNGDDQRQLRSRVGGNPGLKPETANVATVGLVIEPRFLRGFSFTADFYSIDIQNTVSSIGENVILASCYPDAAGKAPQYCSLIRRDPDTQRITQILNLNENVGRDQVNGLDFTANYRLGTSVGTFSAMGAVTWVNQFDRTLADGTVIKGAGTFDLNTGGNAGSNPHFRFNASLGWAYQGFTANIRTYFIGAFKECGDSGADFAGGGLCYAEDAVGERTVSAWNSWDATIGYGFKTPAGQSTIQLGVTNLFDQRPPNIYNGFANTTDVVNYDLALRSFFLRLGHRF
jgi:iron complex outermembrane recepter protein